MYKKKVLIVDDDNLNLKIISRLIGAYGVIINSAHGGKELIDKASSTKYDLIITDEMMPEISGSMAMKKLKSNPEFVSPIVVVTGDTVDGAKEKYLNEGYDYYLVKPINREELDIVMNKYLK